MAFTDAQVEVAQKAQAVATLEPMSSFEDQNSLVATVASEIYEEEVQSLLVEEPWSFAKGQVRLNHVDGEPEGRWTDVWQIPPKVNDRQVLAIRAITVNDIPIKFDRYDDKIFCDIGEDGVVIMDFIFRVSEDKWPPDFKMFVIYSLAALFAFAITRNAGLAEGLEFKADKKLKIARRNYSQGTSSKKVRTKRIVNRRF